MKLSKILVPLDGSTLAETALPAAVDLARTMGASLLLLRAAEAHTVPGSDATEAQVKVVREAESYLDEVKRRPPVATVPQVTTSVWYGTAAEAIAEAARFNHADMIVMTTHGRSGLGRVLLGSVAESVMRSTSTPILVLHPDGAPLYESRSDNRPQPAPPGCASGWMSGAKP